MILLQKYKIQGHSMEPKLKEGSEVLVSSIPYMLLSPKVGDIIAFWHNDLVFIKRIKKVKKSHYLLEGDNVSDTLRIGWITKRDIIGIVIHKL